MKRAGTLLSLLMLTACGAEEATRSESPVTPAAIQVEPTVEANAGAAPERPDETALERGDGLVPNDPDFDRRNENAPDHDRACTMTEPPSRFLCDFDSDCAICHDGSNCGVIVNVAELQRRGNACRQEDAAECEMAAPRCCDGRCVVAGF